MATVQAPGRWRTDLQTQELGVRPLEYAVDGQQPKTFAASEVSTVRADTVLPARSVGDGNPTEIATDVIETGKPFPVVVE